MPFKSKAQAAYMYSQHPGIAKRWSAEAKAEGIKHPIKNLPEKVKSKKGVPKKGK